MVLQEARRLWPETAQVVIISARAKADSGSPRLWNLLVNRWHGSSHHSTNTPCSRDGALRETSDLDRMLQRNYIELNSPFPHNRGGMGRIQCVPPPLQMAVRTLLASCFFFELNELPVSVSTGFFCSGMIRCRIDPRDVLERLSSYMDFKQVKLYKDEMDLQSCFSAANICQNCRRYTQLAQFVVQGWGKRFTLSMRAGTMVHELSAFPTTLGWIVAQQKLNHQFGRANHDLAKQALCTDCTRKALALPDGNFSS